MTHGYLFSGIGGFDLAAQWMGWDNIFHCEWNPFGQKVLKYYWPNAELFTDITKSDFKKYHGTIDIISGGFPCQPYSQAGKRLGKEDERHLWPEMLRAIREVQPGYVVGENVRGLTNWNGGLVFDEVQADLESEGYEVLPFLLPACAVNAPHRRDRVWFIAYNNGKFNGRKRREKGIADGGREAGKHEQEGGKVRDRLAPISKIKPIANANGNGQHRSDGEHEKHASEGREYAQRNVEQMGEYAANTGNQGLQGCDINGGTTGSRAQRNEQLTRLLRSNWSQFPTQSPLCSRNDGISTELVGITFSKHRNESIKAYGNAVVPQVPFEIFKAIEAYDKLS